MGATGLTESDRTGCRTRNRPIALARCWTAVTGAFGGLFLALVWTPAVAHGPVFSPAPETIWQGGTEVTLGYHREEAGPEREQELFLEAEYGLTSRWEIGAELPYVSTRDDGLDSDGVGDLTLGTKYEFWGWDLPGAQYKAGGLFKVKLPTAEDGTEPRLGSGSTDFISGLAAGYESRRWYWFASGVYRVNTEGDDGLEQGDRQFLNLVGGIRPVLSEYDEPDTVLMLELNWERDSRDSLNGRSLADTGGWKLFASPVLWWTYRQVAVRGGVQIPVTEDLNGNQPDPDYRAALELVYHY